MADNGPGSGQSSGELVRYSSPEIQTERLAEEYDGPRFEDFGGLDREIAKLREVGALFSHPELARRWDLKVPTGILLCGPGGVGKTELVHALSYDIGAELREINASDVFGRYIGDSNQNLKTIFDDAAKHAGRLVLFFDEMDGVFGDGAGGNDGVYTTLLSDMKKQMSSLRRQQPHTLVAGAANSSSGFPEALLRPGRFDVILQISRPDLATRTSIFAKMIGQNPELYQTGISDFSSFSGLEDLEHTSFSKDTVDSLGLARETDGLTGADIKDILHQARMTRFMAEVHGTADPTPLTQKEILRCIQEHRKQRLTTGTEEEA
jgi:SpoVK/Ycf46/Vps4 family AAA+-type ATPase